MDWTRYTFTLTTACSDERRLETRFLCADLVRVSWTAGEVFYDCGGNLEDLSPSGCRLLLDQPIPETTATVIRCGKTEFQGTVRYCRSSDIGFDLGIKFNDRGTWKQEEFEPQHLLDLRNLFS
jgi:hypothetical protein